MGFNAKEQKGGGTPLEALEADAYPARVVMVVTMGLQPQQPYQGKDKAPQEEILLGYELSGEFMKDEDGNDDPTKPRWFSESMPFYNLEADRAKSTRRYMAIDPKGTTDGDFSALTSFPCSVTLSKEPSKKHKGSFVNYVSDVSPLPRGFDPAPLVNEPRVFDWEEPDMEVWETLPTWLQDKIKKNLNFSGSTLQRMLDGETSSEQAPEPKSSAPTPSTPPTPPPPPASE